MRKSPVSVAWCKRPWGSIWPQRRWAWPCRQWFPKPGAAVCGTGPAAAAAGGISPPAHAPHPGKEPSRCRTSTHPCPAPKSPAPCKTGRRGAVGGVVKEREVECALGWYVTKAFDPPRGFGLHFTACNHYLACCLNLLHGHITYIISYESDWINVVCFLTCGRPHPLVLRTALPPEPP